MINSNTGEQIMSRTKKPVIERLFAKTKIPKKSDDTNDYTKCWIWCGARLNSGYGVIRVGEEEGMELVHRVVHKHFKPFNHSLEVQHNCGNRLCVNPDHLYIGDIKTRNPTHRKAQKHWLMDGQDVYKTCDVCGIRTHRLWFSRKHGDCYD